MNESQPLLKSEVRKRPRFSWARWAAYSTFGILFILLFNLVFLPRTSVQRDWRRLHHVKVSFPDLERSLFQNIDSNRIRDWSYKYTQERHLAGENYPLVEWTRDKWQEYGIKSEIVQYDVYLNRPVDHAVNLYDESGKVVFSASLKEDKLDQDPTSNLTDSELVPTFHGYSASGNATGKFVYANYGTKEDYDRLVELGIDFTDKVVITRYGRIFRGLKVKFAQDLGASAVLIYSDPADDGGITEKNGYKPYPDGPARNPSSVQRGSVQFLPLLPGDPTTPGYASKPGVDRTDPYFSIPSIPSIPISYRDALPLLKQLNGHGPGPEEIGDGWKGDLDDFDYSAGPSVVDVNVFNEQDYDIRPIWNVIGRIEGVIKDEAIVIGNHRDSWITGGAGDPNSGSAVLIELARAFGELKKLGWRPMRTIILASWDGEEYGLLGSTEWGEEHKRFINAHVLAYLNVDVACSGSRFSASASPLLNDLIRRVAGRVPAPDGHRSLRYYWTGHDDKAEPHIGSLGSGSDYTVFQDHIGVPSMDMGFGPGGNDSVYQYHSNYDSFHWMDTYGDPEWKFHTTVAKLWGLLTITLSEQEVIPFKATEYGQSLADYVDGLQDKLEAVATEEIVRVYGQLKDSITSFIDKAKEFDAYTSRLQNEYSHDYPWYRFYKKITLLFQIKIANFKLFKIERQFVYEGGLDGRPWFKHVVYAPDRYKGYAGVLLPGLSEAIQDSNIEGIAKWTDIIQRAVDSAAKYL
uniref:ARAD1B23584p n=1 Tax=Blastobotrys adeninivorans TaxID=409370 RepID=A0A060T6Z2_BLAAD